MTEFDIGKKVMMSQIFKNIKLINGNCLDILPTLETDSVDLVLTDLPYGTTNCKWDNVDPITYSKLKLIHHWL